MNFDRVEQLMLEFSDYVNWFNKLRIHGMLSYMSPHEYKQLSLKKHTKISSVDNPVSWMRILVLKQSSVI
jgi:hypothetical protein